MPPLPEIRIIFSLSCCIESTGVRRVSQEFVVRPGVNRIYIGKHTIGPQYCWRERKTHIPRPEKRYLLSVLFWPFSWALFAMVFRSPIQEPFADRPVPDLEGCEDLSEALAPRLQFQNPISVHAALRATELLAVGPCVPNPSTHPFPDQITFKLRYR
jgi:hypothetical protein